MYFGSTWGTSHKIFKCKWNHWHHIDDRHVFNPNNTGDLFATGAQLEAAANEIVQRGTCITDPNSQMQRFMMRISINGKPDNVMVAVDSSDGCVITHIPAARGGHAEFYLIDPRRPGRVDLGRAST